MSGKRKKIAIFGPLAIQIPPKKQGAVEWLVYELTERLVARGYPVMLFAPRSTKTRAELAPIALAPINERGIQWENYEKSRKLRVELSGLSMMTLQTLKRKKEIGIILNHTIGGGIFSFLERITDIPAFHTIHLPIFPELAEVFRFSGARVITISKNQRKGFKKINYAATIYNGVDLGVLPFNEKPRDYFVFAGKINRAKNPLDAILAAKKANEKLIIIGKIIDGEYFTSKIKPLIDGKNIKYLGEVSLKKAYAIYQNAKALLMPIKWEESFGLVMIEAMACGTPVIVFNRGSAPEVVADGKTGFIVKNVAQMAKAVKRIDEIDRANCRARVEEKFSVEKMVDEYEKIIQKYI